MTKGNIEIEKATINVFKAVGILITIIGGFFVTVNYLLVPFVLMQKDIAEIRLNISEEKGEYEVFKRDHEDFGRQQIMQDNEIKQIKDFLKLK